MTKKTIAAFICLTFAFTQAAIACGEKHGKHHKHMQKASMNEEMSDRPVIHPTDELSGQVCMPYKYTSEMNKSQVLGVLKNKSIMQSNTSDVSPSESLTGESEEVIKPAPAPVKKVKKAKAKKAKVVKPAQETTPDVTVTTTTTESITTTKEVVGDKYQEPQPTQSAPAATSLDVQTQSTTTTTTKENTQSVVVEPSSTTITLTPESITPTIAGRMVSLEFVEAEAELSEAQKATLDQLAEELQKNPSLIIKVNSLGYVNQGNAIESRRVALQRSIKVRKHLLEKGISPSDITVNVSEDVSHKANKVEVSLSPR
jgi:outer membrane protein OmpA-like peptidoglycan-associated protein